TRRTCMRNRLRSHLTFANVASGLALFMAIGGGGALAIGAIGGGDETLHACYVTKGDPDEGTSAGEVHLLLKGSKCDKGERASPSNAQAPQGPAGVPGPQGEPGADGAKGADGAPGANGTALAFGSVNAQGVLDTSQSSSNVTSLRASEGY